MTELKYIPACAVCAHEKREEIDQYLLDGKTTQKALALQYGVSEQSVSNHKNKHVLDSSMNIERLQLMVQKALAKDLEPDNIGELVRLLEYADKLNSMKCATCEYKLRVEHPHMTIESALKAFLNPDGGDDIYLTPEENNLFIAWLRTLSPDNELRKKYKYFDLKVK